MGKNLVPWRYNNAYLCRSTVTSKGVSNYLFYFIQVLLKKLYVRRMAADLGISKIYTHGKMVGMRSNMSKKVFKIMTESMMSDMHRNCLVFTEKEIKVCIRFCLLYVFSEHLLGQHSCIFVCSKSSAILGCPCSMEIAVGSRVTMPCKIGANVRLHRM